MPVFLVPIVGPDGKQIDAGQPVPKDWDADYVKALTASGGAGTQKQWDAITERNAIEAEARKDEAPLTSWGQKEDQEWRQHADLLERVEQAKALSFDVSGIQLPTAPPGPPQVPDKIREASRALLDADDDAVGVAKKKLAATVEKEAPRVAASPAVAKARHDLAGLLAGEAK